MSKDNLIDQLKNLKPEADNQLWYQLDQRLNNNPKKKYFTGFIPKVVAFGGAACVLLLMVIVSANVLSNQQMQDGDIANSGGGMSAPDVATDSGGGMGEESVDSFGGKGMTPEMGYDSPMPPVTPTDPAADETDRKVVKSATIGLTTESDKIDKVSQRVTDVATKYDAHILTAQVVQSDAQGEAYLQVSVPSDKLEQFIREVAGLAKLDTISRTSQDVTAQVKDINERLAEINAERKSLLAELAVTKNAAQRREISAQLTTLRQEADSLRGQQKQVNQAVAYSQVMVEIRDYPIEPKMQDDGQWSLEDAWGVSKEILTVTASVALLISLVILPWVIVGIVIWMAVKKYRKRRNQRLIDNAS